MGNIEASLGGFGGSHGVADWQLNAPSADARAGLSYDYVGARIGGSLISGEVEGRFRIPGTNIYVIGGLRGELGALGIGAEMSFEDGGYLIGANVAKGLGLAAVIGFEVRGCPE